MSIKRKLLKAIVKTVNKTPVLGKVAQKTKHKIISYVDYKRSQQEIYNLQSYYPTIQDYYDQTHDELLPKDPLISILLPTYNTPEHYLRDCIDSILIQSYSKWELCIADDCSPDTRVAEIIKEYCAKDSRIKFIQRSKNGHISAATNSALEIATGEFIALMDHDDVLWPNALYEVVQAIRTHPKVDHIYTDEDKIDGEGTVHSYPFLKPDMSPEFLESCNYITHFSCIRTSVMKQIGGFRVGYEGAQDWDLFIRISEITDSIIHIPKILYSWRVHEASTASNTDAKPYVYEAQRKLLEDHVKRQGTQGVVETGIIKQHRTIKYEPKENSKLLVAISCNSVSMLKRLLESIKSHNPGTKLDLLYVATSSCTAEEIEKMHNYYFGGSIKHKVTESKGNFYGQALGESKEEYILFTKDTSIIRSENWAKILLAEIQRPNIAFVGPVIKKIGTDMILSAGIGLGFGDDNALDMLQGAIFDDPHYTRGLYAMSRRNVSALSAQMFCTSRAALETYNTNASITDAMYDAVKDTQRNIYTPYVEVVTEQVERPNLTTRLPEGYEDPMLNPNFKKSNPLMEVQA